MAAKDKPSIRKAIDPEVRDQFNAWWERNDVLLKDKNIDFSEFIVRAMDLGEALILMSDEEAELLQEASDQTGHSRSQIIYSGALAMARQYLGTVGRQQNRPGKALMRIEYCFRALEDWNNTHPRSQGIWIDHRSIYRGCNSNKAAIETWINQVIDVPQGHLEGYCKWADIKVPSGGLNVKRSDYLEYLNSEYWGIEYSGRMAPGRIQEAVGYDRNDDEWLAQMRQKYGEI